MAFLMKLTWRERNEVKEMREATIIRIQMKNLYWNVDIKKIEIVAD